MKEPLHPGKIASDLLDLAPHKPVFNDLHMYEAGWRKFAEGRSDIDHVLAYRLSQCIGGTDVAFWLKLQRDYDDHKKQVEHDAVKQEFNEKLRRRQEDFDNMRKRMGVIWSDDN